MSNNYYFRNGGNDNIVDFEDSGQVDSGSEDNTSDNSDFDTRLFIITIKPNRLIKF